MRRRVEALRSRGEVGRVRRVLSSGGGRRVRPGVDMRYHFGPHTLDLGTRELRREGKAVVLEPRTFAVLTHLVRHRDRVVAKEELLDEIWGDRFVGESALSSQIKHARSAVGDDGQVQHTIRTAHRVGYRFVADVVEEPSSGATAATTTPSRWFSTAGSKLFGRDGDLEEVGERLASHRLVTVTGPGGVGKTALAQQLLADAASAAPDGAWLCELANTRDPAAVANVVLRALGEGQQSDAGPLESMRRFLERRRALLVLDSCEHVHDAARDLARELLGCCPHLRILATSRTPLDVDGESVHLLRPLAPSDAAACFAARAADTGAAVEPDDAVVRELCERLDGVPLALELAAARARMLSPAELLALLSDRFRLLRDVRRGGDDDRHHSLHSTIAWSWDALPQEDQALLARLSVFVGPFSLEDARAVALGGGDPLDAVDALGRLVGCSLLVTIPDASGRTQLRLLESVRDFAARELGDATEIRRRHAHHFAARAELLDAAFQTDGIDDALAEMGIAWDNLRAAVGYSIAAGDLPTLQRIIRAVGAYADVFQVYEVLDWCEHAALEDAVLAGGDDLGVAADALAVNARMLAHRGTHDRARALAELAHDRWESHATLLSVVWCAYYRGDLDLVVASAERLLELSRSERGFDRGFAEGFSAIVSAVRQEAAITSTTVTPADAERGVLGTQDCLTEGLRLCTVDPERAAELLEAVVESSIRNDYRLHLGAAASTLTQITLPSRPPGDAMRTLRRTLQRYLDRGMWVLISADTVMAAKLLADHGDIETACRLVGARVASGYAAGLSEVLRVLLQDDLEARVGDRFAELAAQGARWRPPEAAEVAITALEGALGELTTAP